MHFDDVDFAYANGAAGARATSTCTCTPGETVAIVGRTGSGKSTVARLLPRFYDVTAGAVRVDGHDVRDLRSPSLRHHIGIVLDEPFLFSVSIRDNIAYGRPDAPFEDVAGGRASPPAPTSSSRDAARGLRHRGRRARATRSPAVSASASSIARTLLVNPPILVLDDATSARSTCRSSSRSTRRCAADDRPHDADHRPPPVDHQPRRPGRRVEGGRIIADGTHAELLATEPRYAEILAQVEAKPRRRIR